MFRPSMVTGKAKYCYLKSTINILTIEIIIIPSSNSSSNLKKMSQFLNVDLTLIDH